MFSLTYAGLACAGHCEGAALAALFKTTRILSSVLCQDSSVCYSKEHMPCWTSTQAALFGAVTCNALVCHSEQLILCQTSPAGVSVVNCDGCQRSSVSGISAGVSVAVSDHHKLAQSHMFT